ncbi:MAG: TnpV protein [Clostridia bacterium]|nr:TnpV protein [Clostridia bacterium]
MDQIINELKEKSNLTEDIKNTDMLYWGGTMNSIKNQAEEVIYKELVYV